MAKKQEQASRSLTFTVTKKGGTNAPSPEAMRCKQCSAKCKNCSVG